MKSVKSLPVGWSVKHQKEHEGEKRGIFFSSAQLLWIRHISLGHHNRIFCNLLPISAFSDLINITSNENLFQKIMQFP